VYSVVVTLLRNLHARRQTLPKYSTLIVLRIQICYKQGKVRPICLFVLMQFNPRLLTQSPGFTYPVSGRLFLPDFFWLTHLITISLVLSHRPVLSRHRHVIVLFVFQYWQIEPIIIVPGTAQAQLARTAFAALIGPAAPSNSSHHSALFTPLTPDYSWLCVCM